MAAAEASTSFSEDWDRLTPAPVTPPPSRIRLPDDFEESTPGGGTRAARSLSDLMRLHAEHGKENLQLNRQEEQRLEEELAKWVSLLAVFCAHWSGAVPLLNSARLLCCARRRRRLFIVLSEIADT